MLNLSPTNGFSTFPVPLRPLPEDWSASYLFRHYPSSRIMWELIDGSWQSEYYWDKDFDSYFMRYYGWTGGDIGISTLLPDGRNIWTWGDYHTGIVNSERSRLNELWQFPRNGLTIQDGNDFSSFRLMTEGKKLGEIDPSIVYRDNNGNAVSGSQQWYWPMGGNIYYRDGVPELQIVLEHTVNTGGGGAWDMDAISCDVAIYSLPDLKLREVVKDVYVGVIAFANIIFKDDDGIIYIYGERNHGLCSSATFVARNTEGNLAGTWEFYDGKNKVWSVDHSWEKNNTWLEHRVQNNMIFVFKDGGKYYAFEQTACFGRDTYIFDAESPIGPFTNRRLVGKLPTEISEGNFFCYIPALHQQFSKDGELIYCVSKNNKDISWFNYAGSGDIYMPHFFRVKNWRNKLSIVVDDITDNGGVLTVGNTSHATNLTDNDETTSHLIPTEAGKTWIQYESPKSLYLRRYTLTSSPDAPENDPLHWQMLGSNDGANWTVIDERYYAEFEERSQTNCYTVQKDFGFTHFRLNVLAINGSTDLQIAELQLFGQYVDSEYVGIEENVFTENELVVYPNPVSESLTIRSERQTITFVNIYDVNGRIMHSSQPQSCETEIIMSDWAKGIYFVEMYDGKDRYVRKVVKK